MALESGLTTQFGQAGRKRAVNEFAWESIATRTLEVYQNALSG
jgi:starch synthase